MYCWWAGHRGYPSKIPLTQSLFEAYGSCLLWSVEFLGDDHSSTRIARRALTASSKKLLVVPAKAFLSFNASVLAVAEIYDDRLLGLNHPLASPLRAPPPAPCFKPPGLSQCCALVVQDAVQKPFEARQRAGRVRLMALLSRIMIRAAKSDLVTIPPCYHKASQ